MSWLKFNDSEISSDELATKLENSAQTRTWQEREFPSFEPVPFAMAERAQVAHPHLSSHLRWLNEAPAPDTELNLSPSNATQLPVVGRLWGSIRQGFHQLSVFYVNRHIQHQAQHNAHLLNVINELTTLTLSQQQELAELRARLDDPHEKSA